MNVLISGGTGFLGSQLVHGLLKKNINVIVLKRSSSNIWRIADVISDIKFYDVDLGEMERAFKDQYIDAVMHTACTYGRKNESISELVETNLIFGLKLFEFAKIFNTATFFNTDTKLQKNLNAYSLSKKQYVEWLNQNYSNIHIVNMKLEHMYGPKDDENKFVPWLLKQLQENQATIPLTSGLQLRDFVFITDVVSAYLTVLNIASSIKKFTEFDVGSGSLVSVREFASQMSHAYKRLHPENCTRLDFGAKPYRDGEMMTVDIDIRSLKDIGWEPLVDYKSGINKILEVQS